MRCSICSVKQQPELSVYVLPQVLCDIRVQVDLSLGGIGLQIFHDFGSILPDLLLDLDRAPIINDVTGFETKSFENSHPGRTEQNIQCLFLPLTSADEIRNRCCL